MCDIRIYISIVFFQILNLISCMKIFKVHSSHIKDLSGVLFPALDQNLHKGQCGRIAIIGGSPDYTGAPYYAGISSLKYGADLSYVLCAKQAADPIKSYSPELMVTPIYDALNDEQYNQVKRMLTKIESLIPRLHSVVIGPGMGRSNIFNKSFPSILAIIQKNNIPVVIDADGLFFVSESLQTVRNYKRCILTPNAVEFTRLIQSAIKECDILLYLLRTTQTTSQQSKSTVVNLTSESSSSNTITNNSNSNNNNCDDTNSSNSSNSSGSSSSSSSSSSSDNNSSDSEQNNQYTYISTHTSPTEEYNIMIQDIERMKQLLSSPTIVIQIAALSHWLQGVTILRKGEYDILCNSHQEVYILQFPGSPRRCGGQGDILAGINGVNIHWALQKQEELKESLDSYINTLSMNSTDNTSSSFSSSAISVENMNEEIYDTFINSEKHNMISISATFPNITTALKYLYSRTHIKHHDSSDQLSHQNNEQTIADNTTLSAILIGAITSSFITRKSSEVAYASKKRSMTSPDVIQHIGEVVQFYFPS